LPTFVERRRGGGQAHERRDRDKPDEHSPAALRVTPLDAVLLLHPEMSSRCSSLEIMLHVAPDGNGAEEIFW
jgi:hypothetical protein